MKLERRNFLCLGAAFAATSAISVRAMRANVPARDPNLTAFLADPHVSATADDAHTIEELIRDVDEILSLDPLPARAVVFGDVAHLTGDAADYARARDIFDRLERVGVHVHFTTGNHDHRAPLFDAFPSIPAESPVKGRAVAVVDLGTADLILLDSLHETGAKPGDPNDGNGSFDLDQWRWLEAEIARRRRPFLCGAHHNPRTLRVPFPERERNVLELLHPAPLYRGWVQGHDHRWGKFYHAPNRSTRRLERRLSLPSAGFWGDIGYALCRTDATGARVTLRQRDFYYPVPLKPGETPPPEYAAIVRENRFQECFFPFG